MANQVMRIRDKRHFGPSARNVASKRKTNHAFERGLAQGQKGKSIMTNPYGPGLEHDAWIKGYAQALQYTHRPAPNNAPEGRSSKGTYFYSPIVVKRTGAKRNISEKTGRPEKENLYLGYIKPGKNGKIRRFFPFSNNPKEDNNQDRIAGKSDDISLKGKYR
jgi:ribosome modulation factor